MSNTQRFRLPDDCDSGQVDAILADKHAFVAEEPVSERRTFYDTFDWRLYRKSLTLHLSGEQLVLRSLSGEGHEVRASCAAAPTFSWDLPEGPLRKQIHTIVKLRALLQIAEVQLRSRTYRVLNRDEKTVARVVYTEASPPSEAESAAASAFVSLRPVRGYPRYARELAQVLADNTVASPGDADVFFGALEAAGRAPGDYSAKLDLGLEPDMRSEEATRAILRRLLQTMRANEAGIRADIDTEFLHDYRIAVRKTRSALSQVRGVFPTEATARYKRGFRWLGKRTNALRDLDVYLLAEPTYHAMLPPTVRDDIDPLFDHLRSQRKQAHRDVVDTFDSDTYARVLRDWSAFLDGTIPDSAAAANADTPIVDLASRQIYKRFRRIVKDGTYILDHTEDTLLHALRLECKKLRYLLEFFAELFPKKKVAKLIKQLKRLQDNLGEFTDLSVQQDYLRGIADELPLDAPGTRRALVATGHLVETMAQRQVVVKADFGRTFNAFASPENEQAYRKLFGKRGKRGKQGKRKAEGKGEGTGNSKSKGKGKRSKK